MWTEEERKHLLGNPNGSCVVYLDAVEREKIVTQEKLFEKDMDIERLKRNLDIEKEVVKGLMK